jgi:imidazoleglycerol phosphate dehydratase HisB
MARKGKVSRKTKETSISVELILMVKVNTKLTLV